MGKEQDDIKRRKIDVLTRTPYLGRFLDSATNLDNWDESLGPHLATTTSIIDQNIGANEYFQFIEIGSKVMDSLGVNKILKIDNQTYWRVTEALVLLGFSVGDTEVMNLFIEDIRKKLESFNIFESSNFFTARKARKRKDAYITSCMLLGYDLFESVRDQTRSHIPTPISPVEKSEQSSSIDELKQKSEYVKIFLDDKTIFDTMFKVTKDHSERIAREAGELLENPTLVDDFILTCYDEYIEAIDEDEIPDLFHSSLDNETRLGIIKILVEMGYDLHSKDDFALLSQALCEKFDTMGIFGYVDIEDLSQQNDEIYEFIRSWLIQGFFLYNQIYPENLSKQDDKLQEGRFGDFINSLEDCSELDEKLHRGPFADFIKSLNIDN